MKRTRRKRIALALQFDDYSDNLLESSLYVYVYVYQSMPMTMSMMPMRLRLCHSLCYGHMAMPMAMPRYSNYMADTPMAMPKPKAMPMAMPKAKAMAMACPGLDHWSYYRHSL